MIPATRYFDLAGRVVLITGGASGIGAAHVEGFCEQQARVIFLDRQIEAGRALEAELRARGATVTFIGCDLLDLAALGAAIDQVRATHGPVSALINNAAVDQRHGFEAMTADDFEWMMNVNLRHVVFAAQKVVPHMRELGGGSIVNTSSVAWLRGVANLTLYSAAKAAIIGFTNSLARELGPLRIRVNAVAPGYVATPRQRSEWFDPAAEREMLTRQCLPDRVEPRDVAAAAVFLCSDAARMLTKQCLLVNAGSL
ncbi:MAG TPA: SDR family oxidoreductase [Steroidobacteraceae bacterium]|nr:SDR family oxidoreductase [Steroidobacteraceae bacterium]